MTWVRRRLAGVPTDAASTRDGRGWRASPWTALVIVLAGTYGATLNITALGVALPAIAGDEGGDGGLGVDWVITAYLLGVVVVQSAAAWLADRWGRSRIYSLSLAVFGVGAIACALAPTLPVLVAARFVQGLGGGALMPVGMTLVYERFPPSRRGTALGIWGVGIAGAPAAGPPLGGWLVTAAGWRSVFVVSAAVAAVAFVLATAWLRDSGFAERRRFDRAGWVTLSMAVIGVVVIAREAATVGVTHPAIIIGTLATAALIVGVVWHSRRVDEPIIEFDMFTTPTFTATMIIAGLLAVAQYSRTNYLPVELAVVRDLSAGEIGLLLAPGAVGIAVMMPLGGRLTDRMGARTPTLVGLAIVAWAMWQFAHLGPETSASWIVAVLVAQGAGIGLAFVPTTVTAMNCVPARQAAQASVTTNLTRQTSGAIGIAALGALIVSDLGEIAPTGITADTAQDAYNRIFVVAFWLAVVAFVVAITLPGRNDTRPAANGDEHALRPS